MLLKKTAWHLLHKIRNAIAKNELPLSDVVEGDETYIGGKEGNKHSSKKIRAGRGHSWQAGGSWHKRTRW